MSKAGISDGTKVVNAKQRPNQVKRWLNIFARLNMLNLTQMYLQELSLSIGTGYETSICPAKK